MRHPIPLMMLLAVAAAPACSKSEDGKPADKTQGSSADPKEAAKDGTAKDTAKDTPQATGNIAAAASPVDAAGVEAGGIEREASEGPAAVLTAASGTVEVRRVGEAEYQAAKADTPLYAGDQVRTAEGASATLVMADESVVEVAEVSVVAVASRDASADPASGAAVLAGLARFTVTPRAPGEGAFRVYTPSGVVLTKGTVYGVGVAASGEARIGVESGAVELLGLAALDAEPVTVEGGAAVEVAADGNVAGAPAAWTTDDWGTWRDEADAEVEVAAAVDAHGTFLTDLGARLGAAYADLDATAAAYADFETQAATAADASATADYEAVVPEGAATIDASFGLAGSIQAMTWAYAGRAELAAELYARHPEPVKAKWTVVAPHVDAAVLWPKRFEVTAAAYLEPLRVQYYVHHPRGRVHAELVGVAVPEFYAKVEPPEVDRAKVRARVKTKVWAPPVVVVKPQPRPVWIATPSASWRVKVKAKAAPPRAKVRWYVRPPQVRASALLGVDVKARVKPAVVVKPPQPRAKVRAHMKLKGDVGARIKVAPPDLDAAAKARVKVKVDPRGVIVRDHRAGMGGGMGVGGGGGMGVGGGVKGGVGGGVDVKVRDQRDKVDVKVRDQRDKVDVKVRDHRGGAAGAGEVRGKVDAKVKVKAPAPPKVKVKAPSVKVKAKGEVKGGIKIGN